jgi:hypothetical protein
LLGQKITGDLSSLSERAQADVAIWNEDVPQTYYFIVGDTIEKRVGYPYQIRQSSWAGEEIEFEIEIQASVSPRIFDPLGNDRILNGTLHKDVFLTEKEAIESILPWLRNKANWYFNLVGVYTDRLEEIS